MWNSDLPLSAVHIALAGSIVDRGFVDTAYYLFSRRHSSGKIDCPRIVYANSAIMKAASRYFHGRAYELNFNSQFRPSLIDSLTELSAGFSVNNEVVQEAEDYGYESDSDLEDGWGEDDEDDSSHSPSSPPVSAQASSEMSLALLHFSVVNPWLTDRVALMASRESRWNGFASGSIPSYYSRN